MRVELTTCGLRNRCSATELRWRLSPRKVRFQGLEEGYVNHLLPEPSVLYCLLEQLCRPFLKSGKHLAVTVAGSLDIRLPQALGHYFSMNALSRQTPNLFSHRAITSFWKRTCGR